MKPIPTVETEPTSGYERLESQIRWYDSKSHTAQNLYKRVKTAELCCAVLIPFMAHVSVTVTAILGGAIAVLEGLQQMNQWSQNWITYRSTCEALRHEKYAYLGKAASYSGLSDEDAKKVLVSRVEGLISTEHSKWISKQEYSNTPETKV
jgi:hypothetical protein